LRCTGAHAKARCTRDRLGGNTHESRHSGQRRLLLPHARHFYIGKHASVQRIVGPQGHNQPELMICTCRALAHLLTGSFCVLHLMPRHRRLELPILCSKRNQAGHRAVSRTDVECKPVDHNQMTSNEQTRADEMHLLNSRLMPRHIRPRYPRNVVKPRFEHGRRPLWPLARVSSVRGHGFEKADSDPNCE